MSVLGQKTILVIDDDQVLLAPLVAGIEQRGCKVLRATTGEEGLALAHNDAPDVVILDILMPGLDGIATMQRIRMDTPWGMHTPIILLTNISPDNQRIMDAITENAPAYYLVKSDWKLADVIEKVMECLKIAQKTGNAKGNKAY